MSGQCLAGEKCQFAHDPSVFMAHPNLNDQSSSAGLKPQLSKHTRMSDADIWSGGPAKSTGLVDACKKSNSEESDEDFDKDPIDPAFAATPDCYDSDAQQYYAAPYSHPDMQRRGYYEVDVETERQMFVNDVPTRRDSSIPTFSTFDPSTFSRR